MTVAYAAIIPPSLWYLRALLYGFLWRTFVNYGRHLVLKALETGLRKGQVIIRDPVIGERRFGDPKAGPSSTAILNVTNERFWIRVLLSYDIGFSEAYMAGDFESPDLKLLLNLYIDNLERLGNLASPFYHLLRLRDVLATYLFRHGLSISVENVRKKSVAGYNASNDMYKAFLSKEMTYSCPIWGEDEGGVRGDLDGYRRPGDLEAAQARKIDFVLKKARLFPGARLLEIGSGWAGLAIAAAKMGCYVDTITLSVEQQQGAQENIERAGVQDKVTVHYMDYRHLPPEFEKAFDACVSIEMLEAVGVRNMKLYLSKIAWALKDKKAYVVFTSTIYPEPTHTPYQGDDFTRKYHWPNTVAPSLTSLLESFKKYVPGQFAVDYVQDLGDNYPRCLREWGRRFDENWTEKLEYSLKERYPTLGDPQLMEAFRRKWHYMFLYMDVAYSRKWLGVGCWVMKRPGQDPRVCS